MKRDKVESDRRFRGIRTWTAAGFAVLLSFSVLACKGALDSREVLRLNDAIKPNVTITAPEDGSSFAARVVFEGEVFDEATAEGDLGEITSFVYEVSDTFAGGDIELAADGTFSFYVPTTGFPDEVIVTFTAEDWNGNVGEAHLSLADNGAFPLFEVVSGNGSVTVNWNDVTLSESYTLYYTDGDKTQIETYGIALVNVTSPTTVGSLDNGTYYHFMVKSISSDGPDNISNTISTVPLSPLTLAPEVRGGLGDISVTWANIDATNNFEVWRAADRDENYVLRDTQDAFSADKYVTFTDTAVDVGRNYFYSIKPALPNCESSVGNGAAAHPFISDSERELGSYIEDSVDDVDVQGDYAFIATGWAGYQTIDITNLSLMQLVGSAPSSGWASGISVSGTRAYGRHSGGGIDIMSVTGGNSLSTLGGFPFGAYSCYRFDSSGNYVYLATDTALRIINTTDADNPTEVGSYTVASGEDVQVAGTIAYLAAGTTGLVLVDVTTASLPTHLGTLDTDGTVKQVAVSGDYAYVVDEIVSGSSYNLLVVNVSNASTPTQVGSLNFGYTIGSISAQGTTVCVSSSTNGLEIVDVTVPTNPKLAGAFSDYMNIYSTVTLDDRVVLATGNSGDGLSVVSTVLPSPLVEVGDAAITGGARDVVVDGCYAYLVKDTLEIYDVSTPSGPIWLGSANVAGYGVAANGPYIFTAFEETISVIDATNRSSPQIIKELVISGGYAMDVYVRGIYLYVVDFSAGLKVFDVSDPSSPEMLSFRGVTSGDPQSIFLEEDNAFVAVGMSGVVVFDVSDPTSLSEAGVFGQGGGQRAACVLVADNYAYTGSSSWGIRNYDLSGGLSPIQNVQYETADFNRAMAALPPYVFVANSVNGLYAFNMSDPDIFVELNLASSANQPYGLAASGFNLYSAELGYGLRVYELYR